MMTLAWNTVPSLSELAHIISTQPKPLSLLLCLNENRIPQLTVSSHATSLEQQLKTALDHALSCLQFNSINFLHNVLPNVNFWIAPTASTQRLHEHFKDSLQWQTEAIPSLPAAHIQPWLMPSELSKRLERVLVIGAGIAGASTARLLAEQGINVCVLEAKTMATGGSGNRQGLLYAKISHHHTEQTELLLAGYGYTRRLVETLFPQKECWGGNGVLHLNHNETERKRNQALGLQTHHAHLYHSVSQTQASEIAGIHLDSDGLYWPQGIWLNPPAIIQALLEHDFIDVHEHSPLTGVEYDGEHWIAHTPNGDFHGSHIVYCMGAHSPNAAEINVSALPFRQIRGQTGIAKASPLSNHLQCALSGASYISPSWQGEHCYGASFVLNSNDENWYLKEEEENRTALHDLNAPLANSLFSDGINPLNQAHGHSALRCDSPDHLPMVGAIGNIAAMQSVYAKLALDKNYRINNVCPNLPNAYLNTAHGTRGLATAPICSAALVAEILGLPTPLSQRIRTALHPNRTVARAIIRHQNLL